MTRHEAKKKSKVVWIVVIVAIAAAALAGFLVWQNSQPKSGFTIDRMAQDGFLDGKSEAEIQELLNQVVEEGKFNVSINAQPVFKDGRSEGNLRLENVPGNRYYMTVAVTLDDTGETVYESEGIKQGQYIENVTLTKDLGAGEYPATAVFTAINPETLEPVGKTAVELVIRVIN